MDFIGSGGGDGATVPDHFNATDSVVSLSRGRVNWLANKEGSVIDGLPVKSLTGAAEIDKFARDIGQHIRSGERGCIDYVAFARDWNHDCLLSIRQESNGE
jgi:hypothetical protein